jgi:uncharacterized membrane protein YGL010W
MFGDKTWNQWIDEYSRSHRHPVNQLCHSIGIPLIVCSLVVALVGFLMPGLGMLAATLFVTGWVLQFIGHGFERKPPEFFRDWRFLFVGVRWWFAKIRGSI